jgi:hypothetical protein
LNKVSIILILLYKSKNHSLFLFIILCVYTVFYGGNVLDIVVYLDYDFEDFLTVFVDYLLDTGFYLLDFFLICDWKFDD